MAPLEPPAIEQVAPCFGYAQRKYRVHRRYLMDNSWGIMSCSAKSLHKVDVTTAAVPKISWKAQSSHNADSMLRPHLFWIAFSARTNTSGPEPSQPPESSIVFIGGIWLAVVINSSKLVVVGGGACCMRIVQTKVAPEVCDCGASTSWTLFLFLLP